MTLPEQPAPKTTPDDAAREIITTDIFRGIARGMDTDQIANNIMDHLDDHGFTLRPAPVEPMVPKAAYDELAAQVAALTPMAMTGTWNPEDKTYPTLPHPIANETRDPAKSLQVADVDDTGQKLMVLLERTYPNGSDVELGWFDPAAIVSNLLPFLPSDLMYAPTAVYKSQSAAITDLNAQVRDRDATIKELDRQISVLQKTNNDLKADLSNQRDAYREKNRELADANQKCADAIKASIKGEELRVIAGLVKRRGAVVDIDGVRLSPLIEDGE